MLGLFIVVILPTAVFLTAWIYYNKGINKTGHVCATVKFGPRYVPSTLKTVELPCFECKNTVACELKVTRRNDKYIATIDETDLNAHKAIHHNSEANGKK